MGLRLLHVAQSSEYGLGRYLADLVEVQRAADWEVTVAGDPASEIRPRVLDAGAAWVPWKATRQPGPSILRETRDLRAVVESVRPDVVHLHSSKAGVAGRLALRGSRPTIFQPHAWSFFAGSPPVRVGARLWERVAARWATVVVCGSEGEKAQGVAAGIKARQWRVVPNAVDTDRFAPRSSWQARQQLGIDDDDLVVVCAARLAIAQKGQDVLLRAWPKVEAQVDGARLFLIGDGPDRKRLEAEAAASVTFAGGSDDMPSWFAAADVVVAPSRYETLSLSVLEAMACGRPVVASDAVGMREAVGDDSGAIVPIGDADALAEALVLRLKDRDRAALEGVAARSRVEGAFSRRRWGEAMLALTSSLATPGPLR